MSSGIIIQEGLVPDYPTGGGGGGASQEQIDQAIANVVNGASGAYDTLKEVETLLRDVGLRSGQGGHMPTIFKDELDLKSNSEKHAPTQRAIKTYISREVAKLNAQLSHVAFVVAMFDSTSYVNVDAFVAAVKTAYLAGGGTVTAFPTTAYAVNSINAIVEVYYDEGLADLGAIGISYFAGMQVFEGPTAKHFSRAINNGSWIDHSVINDNEFLAPTSNQPPSASSVKAYVAKREAEIIKLIPTSVLGLVDEDDFASDSDTQVPSQQSVKAYIEANYGQFIVDDILTTNWTSDAAVLLPMDGKFIVSSRGKIFGQTPTVAKHELGVLADDQRFFNRKDKKWYYWEASSNTMVAIAPVDIIDEDDMASDSAVKVPTQQSVKAYVDVKTDIILDEDDMVSDLTTKVPSQQSVKKFVEDKMVNDPALTNSSALQSPTENAVKQYVDGKTKLATNTVTGISRLATDNEAKAGLSNIPAMTPQGTRLFFENAQIGELSNVSATIAPKQDDLLTWNAATSMWEPKVATVTIPDWLTTDATSDHFIKNKPHVLTKAEIIVDEDDMSSDLDDKAPSQQSVKAYADSKVLNETNLLSNLTTKAPSQASVRTYVSTQIANFFVGAIIDEDDMASDDNTRIPSQQSVKAYVDAEVSNAGGGISNFDATRTYAVGDVVIHNDQIYQANAAITAGAFDPTKWTALSVSADASDTVKGITQYATEAETTAWTLKTKAINPFTLDKALETTRHVGGRAWAPNKRYQAGDMVIRGTVMYTRLADGTSGATFDTTEAATWHQVNAGIDIYPKVVSRIDTSSAVFSDILSATAYDKSSIRGRFTGATTNTNNRASVDFTTSAKTISLNARTDNAYTGTYVFWKAFQTNGDFASNGGGLQHIWLTFSEPVTLKKFEYFAGRTVGQDQYYRDGNATFYVAANTDYANANVSGTAVHTWTGNTLAAGMNSIANTLRRPTLPNVPIQGIKIGGWSGNRGWPGHNGFVIEIEDASGMPTSISTDDVVLFTEVADPGVYQYNTATPTKIDDIEWGKIYKAPDALNKTATGGDTWWMSSNTSGKFLEVGANGGTGTAATSIATMSDVYMPFNPTDGHALIWNSTNLRFESGLPVSTVAKVSDIGDVNAPTPTAGQALVWNDTTSKWDAVDITPADASTSVKGIVKLADHSETIVGTSDTTAVTPAELKKITDSITAGTERNVSYIIKDAFASNAAVVTELTNRFVTNAPTAAPADDGTNKIFATGTYATVNANVFPTAQRDMTKVKLRTCGFGGRWIDRNTNTVAGDPEYNPGDPDLRIVVSSLTTTDGVWWLLLVDKQYHKGIRVSAQFDTNGRLTWKADNPRYVDYSTEAASRTAFENSTDAALAARLATGSRPTDGSVLPIATTSNTGCYGAYNAAFTIGLDNGYKAVDARMSYFNVVDAGATKADGTVLRPTITKGDDYKPEDSIREISTGVRYTRNALNTAWDIQVGQPFHAAQDIPAYPTTEGNYELMINVDSSGNTALAWERKSGTQAERPSTANSYTGQIYYNTNTNRVNIFNGTAWVDMMTGAPA